MDSEYQPITVETDPDGILRGHSDVLGLDLCVRQGIEEFEGRALLELRLYDPATGEWLRTHQESELERIAAEDRAHAERQRAAAAQQRAPPPKTAPTPNVNAPPPRKSASASLKPKCSGTASHPTTTSIHLT